MPLFEFYAHNTPSMYGQGSAGEAGKLCSLMNQYRSLNHWDFREVTEARGPVMNLAEN
jgi:hypothetical protein